MAEVWGLLSQLRPHLDQREEVLAVVQGAFEAPESGSPTPRPGILVATQQRVAFFPEGAGDGDLLPFAYEDMSDLSREMSILGHEMTFRVDGRTARLSRISDGLSMEQFATAVSERMVRDGAARRSNSGELQRPPSRAPGPPAQHEGSGPPAAPAAAAPGPPTGRPPADSGAGSNDASRWAPPPADASPQTRDQSRGPQPPSQNSGPLPSGPIPQQDRFFTPPGHVDRSARADAPTAPPPSPPAPPPVARPDRTRGLHDSDDSTWAAPSSPPRVPPAEAAPRPTREPTTPSASPGATPSSGASGPIPARDTDSHRPPATSGPIPTRDADPDRTASGPIPTGAPSERSATSSPPPAPPPSPPTPPKPPVEQPDEPSSATHREDDPAASVATPERSRPTATSSPADSEPAPPVPTPVIADRTPLFDTHPRAPSLRAAQQGEPKSTAPGREPADEDTRRLTIFRALDVIRDLHRLGVLSTDEWAAQRADLLNRL